MAEAIDENRLLNDLRYRFNYVSKFVDFTQNDIDTLNNIAPVLAPLLPDLVEQIYAKLHSYSVTRDYFYIRNDGFETFDATQCQTPDLLNIQTNYRKDMLSFYLNYVLTQTDWDDEFLQYLSRVGGIHTSKDGSSLVHVNYIHINLLFAVVESALINAIWHTEQIDREKQVNVLMAINKFFWIQNDFFSKHYILPLESKSTSTVPVIGFAKCFFH